MASVHFSVPRSLFESIMAATNSDGSNPDMTALLNMMGRHELTPQRMARSLRSSQFVIEDIPCAHESPAEHTERPNRGVKTCSRCRLVFYCSEVSSYLFVIRAWD